MTDGHDIMDIRVLPVVALQDSDRNKTPTSLDEEINLKSEYY